MKRNDTPTTKSTGRFNGPGLKPGVNEADTFGVVHMVKGTVSFGRMGGGATDGNSPKRNSMVSGNSSRKK